MSIIGNINLGVFGRREKHNLSQDTHTTSDVGYLQPTFCRDIVPGSHLEISARSLVRLSPLAVPTMGRLSLRNYFYFVDFSTLWSPFEAMRTGTNYTYPDGVSTIPQTVPFFTVRDLFRYLYMYYSPTSVYEPDIYDLQQSLVASMYKDGTIVSDKVELQSCIDIIKDAPSCPFVPRFWTINNTVLGRLSLVGSAAITYDTTFTSSAKQITRASSDFSISVTTGGHTYVVLGKFYGATKRLRKILIGCGYSFNPYDNQQSNWFKLFAVYKAYFDTFGISRTTNFLNSYCYQLIKWSSETRFLAGQFDVLANKQTTCNHFFAELAGICYTLPPDYFSVADNVTYRSAQQNQGVSISSYYGTGGQLTESTMSWASASGIFSAIANLGSGNYGLNAVAMQMARKLLPMVNKQSVIGRKVCELAKLESVYDEHNDTHELTHKLGATRTDIDISDVMSFAKTDDGSLGDFAGKGIGYSDGERFFFDSKSYGVLICLSCIVPNSGYFQGLLRENSDGCTGRYDFYTQEFDALGTQNVRVNELIADLQFQNSGNTNQVGTDLGNWRSAISSFTRTF